MEYKLNFESIGGRIASERKKLKDENGKSWSQDTLIHYLKEKNLGISRNTLSALENGSSISVDFNVMLELCKLFDCELGYLLCEKGYENKTRTDTDIVNETGLSEFAVKRLKYHNDRIKNGQLLDKHIVSLYSRIIEDKKFATDLMVNLSKIYDSMFKQLWTKELEAVFTVPEIAVDFYKYSIVSSFEMFISEIPKEIIAEWRNLRGIN